MHTYTQIESDVTLRWKLWNYKISGYYGNELSKVNKLHDSLDFDMWSVAYRIKETGLKLITHACYSLEVALNVPPRRFIW
jgi:hypothetical protein